MPHRTSGKTLISRCYSLSVYQVPLYRDLVKVKEHAGVITKRNNAAFLYIQNVNPAQVKIRVVIGDATYHQLVNFVFQKVGYGHRRIIKCDCGQLVRTLYFKDNYFACRHCHNLLYDIRQTRVGRLQYKLKRREKLLELRASMKSLFWCGNYTKKARKIIEMSKKWS